MNYQTVLTGTRYPEKSAETNLAHDYLKAIRD
jgi:hypothetical protein